MTAVFFSVGNNGIAVFEKYEGVQSGIGATSSYRTVLSLNTIITEPFYASLQHPSAIIPIRFLLRYGCGRRRRRRRDEGLQRSGIGHRRASFPWAAITAPSQ